MDKISDVDEVEKDIDVKAVRNAIFFVLLIFALVALIAAIMGIGSCKIKNRCYTCCYGILLLPTWIVIFVMGGISVWVSLTAEDVIED